MSIRRVILGFAGVMVVAGIAASLVIEQSSRAKLIEKAGTARQQAEHFAQLSADNERLSNLVARAASPQALPPDQFRELLRLRGQIGVLRQGVAEQAQLKAANQQLRAGRTASEQELAAARAAPNFWAKEQLAFAGYADPEAALKTVLWAMSKGDMKAYLMCCANEEDVKRLLAMKLSAEEEAKVAAEGRKLSENLSPAIGFHILDRHVKSADEVILGLSFDGEGKTRKFVMKKVGNEWKLDQMRLALQADP